MGSHETNIVVAKLVNGIGLLNIFQNITCGFRVIFIRPVLLFPYSIFWQHDEIKPHRPVPTPEVVDEWKSNEKLLISRSPSTAFASSWKKIVSSKAGNTWNSEHNSVILTRLLQCFQSQYINDILRGKQHHAWAFIILFYSMRFYR